MTKEHEIIPKENDDEIWIAVAECFREQFGLSSYEMGDIFRLRNHPAYTERVESGTLSKDTDAWHRTASYLGKLLSLTTGLLKENTNPVSLKNAWLHAQYPGLEKTRLQALIDNDHEILGAMLADLGNPKTVIEDFCSL